jgi:hypothetical protein
VSAAIERVATVDEGLAHHLQTRIRTGVTCVYEPECGDNLEWVVD